MIEMQEIEYNSIEYNGTDVVYACYLSGKELTIGELDILTSILYASDE
jgi:hypothetical protein